MYILRIEPRCVLEAKSKLHIQILLNYIDANAQINQLRAPPFEGRHRSKPSFVNLSVLPTLGRNFQPAQQKNSTAEKKIKKKALKVALLFNSVADPDPHPNLDTQDPYVLGPPGSASGSINQRSGSESGSGSFYHQAKIVRKTLIPCVLCLLYDFLSLKNDVNVPSKSNKQTDFFVDILKIFDENGRIRIRIWIHQSEVRIRIRIRTKISWIRNIRNTTF